MGVPSVLTSSTRKAELYGYDTYFLEGFETASIQLGAKRAVAWASQHTLLLLKPELLATGRLPLLLEWLERHDISILAAWKVRLSRHAVRALWFYHWNSVTPAHRVTVDRLLHGHDCVVLVLHCTRDWRRSSPLWLSTAKGSAKVSERAPGELRWQLGNYNALLNFVHSPNEPADVLRELAVLLDPDDLRSAFDAGHPIALSGWSEPLIDYDLGADSLIRQIRAAAPGDAIVSDLLEQWRATTPGMKPAVIKQLLMHLPLSQRIVMLAAALGTYEVVSTVNGLKPMVPTFRAPRS